MPTLRLTPSTYQFSNTTYLSISNASNMYENTDSDTYATITNNQTGTTSYYLYIRGFDFSQLPNEAVVTDWTVKLKARESGISTSSSYAPKLCHGTSQITSTMSAISSTTTTREFTDVGIDWEDVVGYGSDFGIRINCRRSNRNTTGYVYVYGAEIEVTYTIPIYHNINITNTTSAVVAASNTHPMEGDNVIITASTLNGINITDNGTDITNNFVQGSSENITSYPTAYDINGNISGTHYTQCIGQGLDNTVSGNDYSSSSGSTAYIDYSFEFNQIPAGATIQTVSVKVKGHCESTSSSSEVATLQLYSGSTAKGNEEEFTSTSDQTITMTPGTWTATELQNAILRFTVGYYGGAISGVEWTVSYEINDYVYTITNIIADHVIVVTEISIATLYIKSDSAWVQVTHAYQKINGSWVEKSLDNVFDQTKKYRRI